MDTAPASVPSAAAFPTPCINPGDLALRLGMPAMPLVLDVRRQPRFDASDRIVSCAVRCAPEDVPAFAAAHAPGEAYVYCVYGHGVSHEAVAALNAAGWRASYLAGGIEGGEPGVDCADDIAAWRARPVPTIRKRPDLGVTGERASRWVTRERPKIDRVACPWLVRRFIDSRAEFHYVSAAAVFDRARDLGAVAYDIPGAPISHEGQQCSFDALLQAFDLRDEALDVLARIVRGADTDQLALAAESAGLLALSQGLSFLHADDDHAMLEAAMPLYDALYAFCRLRVRGVATTHSWQPPAPQPGGRP